MKAPLDDDPRRPDAISPYHVHEKDPDDLPFDMYALASVIFGIAGLMFKVTICSWIALICCVVSYVTMDNSATDTKQLLSSTMFGIMGIVTNYVQRSG